MTGRGEDEDRQQEPWSSHRTLGTWSLSWQRIGLTFGESGQELGDGGRAVFPECGAQTQVASHVPSLLLAAAWALGCL